MTIADSDRRDEQRERFQILKNFALVCGDYCGLKGVIEFSFAGDQVLLLGLALTRWTWSLQSWRFNGLKDGRLYE